MSHPSPQPSIPSSHAPALPVPSQERVAGFQSLYQQKFGVCLDSDEAARILTLLMHLAYLSDQKAEQMRAAQD